VGRSDRDGTPLSASGRSGAPESVATADSAPHVLVDGVSKVFRNGTVALAGIDLTVGKGQFVSIVGASGCGKSTLLRIIAGLSPPTSGRLVTPDDPKEMAFVFQEPTLLPWRTVQRNCELLLELDGVPPEERARRAADALELVGLSRARKQYPRQLSGGMKMRLALARVLAVNATLVLLDEPFSAVDEITRETLNTELQNLWLTAGFTGLFVTHNVAEAVFLSQRVIVLSPHPGRLVADVPVDLPLPRTLEDRTTPEFIEIVARVGTELRAVR